jgi:hypothetical protein
MCLFDTGDQLLQDTWKNVHILQLLSPEITLTAQTLLDKTAM